MTLPTIAQVERALIYLCVLGILAVVLSFLIGRTPPKPPKPIPGRIDVGRVQPPEPEPVPQVQTPISAPAARLTLAQVQAEAKRYGFKLTREQEDALRAAQEPVSGPQNPEGTPPPPETVLFPLRLASEAFCMKPGKDGSCPETSPGITVSAWQFSAGEAVDLRGAWKDYTPPPARVPVAENVARWELEAGPAFIVTPGGSSEIGGQVSLSYSAFRLGPVTLRARGTAFGAPTMGAGGFASLALSFGRSR